MWSDVTITLSELVDLASFVALIVLVVYAKRVTRSLRDQARRERKPDADC